MLLYNPAKYLSSTILLVACFWPRNSQQQDVTQPTVTIPQGTLRGTTVTTRGNRTVSAFLAIPYAKPPIGNLRFASPLAADSWTGTLDADVDGNICLQADGGSEDCLHIKIYTPQLPRNASTTLLPVMVWVFGGGFLGGSPNHATPEYLLDSDVVLAAPNYRAGPFGFLSTGDEAASGNWGLKDLVLALQWVQRNIEYFGGDPNRVTLLGQSAGAVSVHLLTLSDATVGLFHRYITQSGSALAIWAHHPRTAYASLAFQLGEYVGCYNDTSASLITCLREINASDIVATYPKFLFSKSLSSIVWTTTDEPDIDGAILTDSPANIFAAGNIRDLPWMTGAVRDDGVHVVSGLYADDDALNYFFDNFDNQLPQLLSLTYQPYSGAAWVKAIKSYYFNDDLTTANKSEIMTKLATLMSDALFFYPTYNALQQQLALAVNPQYFYAFDYRGSLSHSLLFAEPSANYGVVHADELIYLFPESKVIERVNVSMSDSDFRMVDTMVELWTSFAINGTPTTSANNNTVTWEPYSTANNYLRIGNNSQLGLGSQYPFFEERMQFLASLYATTNTSDALTVRPI